MKGLRIVVMLFLVFVVSAPLFAAPPEQTVDTSSTLYASGLSILCSDTWGCPACVSNMEGTMSMCAKIRFANGWCVCANPKPPTATAAVCTTLRGSCKFLW
ncbi:MAG: hypothetical protein QOI24_33 [Acidobacteriota bacterium]|nr:hypothetical protein [Acidobacteriota bacterium]